MKKLFLTFLLAGTFSLLQAQISPKLSKDKTELNALQAKFAKQMDAVNATLAELKTKLEATVKDLEAEDRLGNFEIQRLKNMLNEAQTLATGYIKKVNESSKSVMELLDKSAGH